MPNNLFYFFYCEPKGGGLLRILARLKPGEFTRPISGQFWLMSQFDSMKNEWVLRKTPEIAWRKLKDFQYIGKLKA